ncbi:unnamed protein product [Brachionus calyciflorus]|uniref:Uncharacterized protein n=1 Tax=Brachionus calyciflorus TaxID=104777 RepID=A0A813ZT95_9BILA|nr:unnamed protein product [Brachionus calyciflorus]
MSKLIVLDLLSNQIKLISDKMLFSLTDLEYLFLDYNQINTIEDLAFNNLSKLKHLSLSYNKLTKYSVKDFYCLKVQNIDLCYNQIEHINKNNWDILSNLKNVWQQVYNLSRNDCPGEIPSSAVKKNFFNKWTIIINLWIILSN